MSPASSPAGDPAVASSTALEQEMTDDQLWATEDTLEDLDWDALEQTLSQIAP